MKPMRRRSSKVSAKLVKKPRNASEHDICVALCDYVQWNYRELWEVFYHIKNESNYSMMRVKSSYHANNIKKRQEAIGFKKGVFDYSGDLPRNGYHGLRMEAKSKTGRPTKNQKEWLERYRKNGYYAVIFKGLDEGMYHIDEYMK